MKTCIECGHEFATISHQKERCPRCRRGRIKAQAYQRAERAEQQGEERQAS